MGTINKEVLIPRMAGIRRSSSTTGSPGDTGSPNTTGGSNTTHQPPTTPHPGAESGAASTLEPLEGKALLDKARSLSNRPEDQIARACGYVGPSGRVLKKSFYRALVAAKGYTLPSNAMAGGLSRGRHADFRTRVHGNGNLLIGQAYTRRMGLEPGQEFRIELHRETGSIWLLPLETPKK